MRRHRSTLIRRVGKIALAIHASLMLFTFTSCLDDDFDEKLSLQNIPIEYGFVDLTLNPVPGNGGIITTASITESSVQLIWTRATDDSTLQSDLLYRVIISKENNIGSISDTESSGIILLDWTADMISIVADGLSESTTYFFTVLVMDDDKQVSAYTVVSAATKGNVIYLFSAGARTGGMAGALSNSDLSDVSVRDNLDKICLDAKYDSYSTLPCLNVRAFISIASSDSIAGMPEQFGIPTDSRIKGTTGIQVAPDWESLFSCDSDDDSEVAEEGCLDTSLEKAGIIDSFWWSGSRSDGTYYSDGNSSDGIGSAMSCNSWTSSSNEYQGRVGDHNRISSLWISGKDQNCNNSFHLLCACW